MLLQLLSLLLDFAEADLLALIRLLFIVVLESGLLGKMRRTTSTTIWLLLSELQFEPLNFKLQLSDNVCVLRDVIFNVEHIPLHICFDVLRSIGIFERIVRVFVV